MTTYYYFFCPALYRKESPNAPDCSKMAFEVSTQILIEYSFVCQENPPPNDHEKNYLTYTAELGSRLVIIRNKFGGYTPEGREYFARYPGMSKFEKNLGQSVYDRLITPIAGKYFTATPTGKKDDPLSRTDVVDIRTALAKRTPATRAKIAESLKILRVKDPSAATATPSAACVRRRQLPAAIVLAGELGLDLGIALAITTKFR